MIKVSLLGNPNVGKTSIFNLLTGLNQKVGNYPGITVEKKVGTCKLSSGEELQIIDLPGTYSVNSSSKDEDVVVEHLLNKDGEHYPDVAVVITEVENLKRNLLLFTQIKDLEIPTILVINMSDRMALKGIELDIPYLEKRLNTKIVLTSSRRKSGIEKLKSMISDYKSLEKTPCLNASSIEPEYFNVLKKSYPEHNLYRLWLANTHNINYLNLEKSKYETLLKSTEKNIKHLQHNETILRYQFIEDVLKDGQKINKVKSSGLQNKIDSILTHKVYGYLIFFVILFLLFQSIFDFASVPMDFIDSTFANLSSWIKSVLPPGVFTELIADGIIPGISGVVIFIPQIAFLFLFISILEESGYMSRVVFIMDRLMRPFGLSGKSVVPLISGTACAIPAIMGTRNIESRKERLITILITPFITCSARLPVYAIIIALIIPDVRIFGIMSYQGLTLMTMYVLGFLVAILSAVILNKFIKSKSISYFVVELPGYKVPMVKNIMITVVEKTKSFVFGAGKIILALSVILWFLGSHGVSENFKNAETIVKEQNINNSISEKDLEDKISSFKLENSFIGFLGKQLEPAITPLGYDWKIGIAIVGSFAAREVFVATLATIYSVGSQSEEEQTIKSRMESEVNPVTGKKVFNFATGISLLLFYAFSMMCISTIAIVKSETNSWKWTFIQLVFMSVFAYSVALIGFQIFK